MKVSFELTMSREEVTAAKAAQTEIYEAEGRILAALGMTEAADAASSLIDSLSESINVSYKAKSLVNSLAFAAKLTDDLEIIIEAEIQPQFYINLVEASKEVSLEALELVEAAAPLIKLVGEKHSPLIKEKFTKYLELLTQLMYTEEEVTTEE